MYKIYSRFRIRIPKINIPRGNRLQNEKRSKRVRIILIIIIAFSTVKLILDAVLPIFDTLCINRAKSIATIISNEQATVVMKEHTYDELYQQEKDSNGNVTMIKANIISINEIISDVAIKIQQEIDKRGQEDVQIALRKFYRI